MNKTIKLVYLRMLLVDYVNIFAKYHPIMPTFSPRFIDKYNVNKRKAFEGPPLFDGERFYVEDE